MLITDEGYPLGVVKQDDNLQLSEVPLDIGSRVLYKKEENLVASGTPVEQMDIVLCNQLLVNLPKTAVDLLGETNLRKHHIYLAKTDSEN